MREDSDDQRHGPIGPAVRIALALILSGLSRAWADAGPPMITDDPGTVPDGQWEINLATTSARSAETTTFDAPLVDINYGAGENLQLKFELPWIIDDRTHGRTRSGAGTSLIGAKWHFHDGGEDGWQLATYPQVESTFPFARTANGIAAPGVGYLLPIEAQHRFAAFDLNVEIGRWLRPAAQSDTWITGVVVSHDARKGFTLFAELHDEADTRLRRDELIVNLGLRLDLTPRYTLLLSAGSDLHNGLGAAQPLLTYAAIQLHL